MSEFDDTQRAFNELAMDLAPELGEMTKDIRATPIGNGFTLVSSEAAIPASRPEVEKFLDGTPVPAGYGQGNLEEVKAALSAARKSGDTQAILDAHHAWMDLGDELTVATDFQAERRLSLFLALAVLLAGIAFGFGVAAILFGLVR